MEEKLNWIEAKEHLMEMRTAYEDLGSPGLFGLVHVINPLVLRLIGGERTAQLYTEVMAVR